jgi:hypothetical protein
MTGSIADDLLLDREGRIARAFLEKRRPDWQGR